MITRSNQLLTLLAFLCFQLNSFAQPTVGLRFNSGNAFEGYTLFSPEIVNDVFLIDNCGEIINTWRFTELPDITCYLNDNGDLLRVGKDSLELRDWNNELIWSYALTANGFNQHHDIEPMPNGNILLINYDTYSDSEMVEAGRDPDNVSVSFLLDKIIELRPSGKNDAQVVWEWRFMDHLIQDINPNKSNFGVIKDHPELLDINFENGFSSDYIHSNSIDYNPDLDHIIISTRHLSELYIIDHSTTTAEAAGHTGGNYNRGGDFLWRWGNQQVYGQGDDTNQKLFLQHDAKWVKSGFEDAGQISVFNNLADGFGAYSAVHLIKPKIVSNAYILENGTFFPSDFDWSWNGQILGTTMNEGKKSGVESLPNGNLLIAESTVGQITEINKSGDILWVYKSPVGINIANQNDQPISNEFFRVQKYPTNFAGFANKDLTPKGTIENENELSAACRVVGIESLFFDDVYVVNPVSNGTLSFSKNVALDALTVIDITGKEVFQEINFNAQNVSLNLAPGPYLLQVRRNQQVKSFKLIIQ